MKRLITILILLISAITCSAQVNYIEISPKIADLHNFTSIPDSVKKRLVDDIYLLVRVKNATIDSTIQINITNFKHDTIVFFPESMQGGNILKLSYQITFKVLDQKQLNITKDELAKYMDTRFIKYRIIRDIGKSPAGLQKCSFEEAIDAPAYCMIASIPPKINADVYFMSEDEWEHELNFKSPPISNTITTAMVDKIRGRLLGNFTTAIKMQKEDRNYILVIDHSGKYTAMVIDPWRQDEFSVNVR